MLAEVSVELDLEDNENLHDLCEWLNAKPVYKDLGVKLNFYSVARLAFRRGLQDLLANLKEDSWPPVDMSRGNLEARVAALEARASAVSEADADKTEALPEPEEDDDAVGVEYVELDDVGEMPLPPWEDIHRHGSTIEFYDPGNDWHPKMKGRYGDLLDYYIQRGWLAFVGHNGDELEAFLFFWAPNLDNNLETPPFRSDDFRHVPVVIEEIEDSHGLSYGNAHFIMLRGV